MKILITGGLGFIGSAVVRLAIERGYKVINIDSQTYASNIENVSNVQSNPNYIFERVDIRDREALSQIFKKYQPDKLMHLAAESHVDRSIDEPEKFIETNITGTFNLLSSALYYWHSRGSPDTFRFHHISTDEVYGSLSNDLNIKFTENFPYKPRSPYSASKASSDHLVRAWHETYSLPVVLTNCSNNYGPYHFPEKFIPLIIINCLTEKPLPIYGDGSHIRDWLYVEDHAEALLLASSKGKIGYSYNIGGDNQSSNLELVQKLCTILDKLQPRKHGIYSDLISFVKDRPGHDFRYAIDSNLIQKELGWKPSVSLFEGLEKTVKWYLENKNWWKPLLGREGVGERLGIKK